MGALRLDLALHLVCTRHDDSASRIGSQTAEHLRPVNESQNPFLERRKRIARTLSPGIVAEPLATRMRERPTQEFACLIELNAAFPPGMSVAHRLVDLWIVQAVASNATGLVPMNASQAATEASEPLNDTFIFARLTGDAIRSVIQADARNARILNEHDPVPNRSGDVAHHERRAIFRIWDSPTIGPLTTVSVRTVKADAAQRAFNATGRGIVWAVIDSGIQGDHPHFRAFRNLDLDPPAKHRSFVAGETDPLVDPFGHGTHVAGIIGGQGGDDPQAAVLSYDDNGDSQYHIHGVPGIGGMAPECKIISLRVLGPTGDGDVSGIIKALQFILDLNAGGRTVIHGVNLSVGYPFDGKWYACGQTPVCRMVDRLAKSGVVVVAASGNSGHTLEVEAASQKWWDAGQLMSINDPGNSALAITVGSTDRERPHAYGVSYFSSKGPTGDGRCKPDVVAPGEHVISAAAGGNRTKVPDADIDGAKFDYVEDSGTSMAAPHVSGIVAGFLSIRPEYIGEALQVRDLVIGSAMDLKRDRNLQGAGLVDLMRLIQSV